MSKKIKAISTDEIEGVIITIQLPNSNKYELFFDEVRDGLIIYKINAGRKHIKALKDADKQIFIK
jgi:hypothetical protein